jgi:hypothetical protein
MDARLPANMRPFAVNRQIKDRSVPEMAFCLRCTRCTALRHPIINAFAEPAVAKAGFERDMEAEWNYEPNGKRGRAHLCAAYVPDHRLLPAKHTRSPNRMLMYSRLDGPCLP